MDEDVREERGGEGRCRRAGVAGMVDEGGVLKAKREILGRNAMKGFGGPWGKWKPFL